MRERDCHILQWSHLCVDGGTLFHHHYPDRLSNGVKFYKTRRGANVLVTPAVQLQYTSFEPETDKTPRSRWYLGISNLSKVFGVMGSPVEKNDVRNDVVSYVEKDVRKDVRYIGRRKRRLKVRQKAGRRFYRIQLYTFRTPHTQLNTAHFYMPTTRYRTTLKVHNSIQHNSTRHNSTRHNSTRHNSTWPQLDTPQLYTATTRHSTTLHRPHGRMVEATEQ